jgi:hypothetical protein
MPHREPEPWESGAAGPFLSIEGTPVEVRCASSKPGTISSWPGPTGDPTARAGGRATMSCAAAAVLPTSRSAELKGKRTVDPATAVIPEFTVKLHRGSSAGGAVLDRPLHSALRS